MAKNRGIITTTQDAISDVARTGVEGARSIAGSAVDTAAGAANSAAKAVTGAALYGRPPRPAAGRPGQEAQDGEAPGKAKKVGQAEDSGQTPAGEEIGAEDGAAKEEISRDLSTK